jgi:hypothetical protein
MGKENEDLFNYLTLLGTEGRKLFYEHHSVFYVDIDKQSVNITLDRKKSVDLFIENGTDIFDINRLELYKKYVSFCKEMGKKEYGKKIFFNALRKSGKFEEKRFNGDWCFFPIAIE